MKLYFAPGACSLAVHIALRETSTVFAPVRVDLASHTLADGSDYFNISSRGYVPLLELDDGSRHTEAAALLQYVADLDASQSLIGATGTGRRMEVIEWLTFVSTELHRMFSPWLWHKETAESTRATVISKLTSRFADLDQHFVSHEYLSGAFSVADAYAFTIVNWATFLALPLTSYPHLQAYMARVTARPAVQEALRFEGLTK